MEVVDLSLVIDIFFISFPLMWTPDCLIPVCFIHNLFVSGPVVRWACDEYFSQGLLSK
jgi:hypothetical protein